MSCPADMGQGCPALGTRCIDNKNFALREAGHICPMWTFSTFWIGCYLTPSFILARDPRRGGQVWRHGIDYRRDIFLKFA